MKELLLRIRHWLIKKLGGYTEQYVPQQVRVTPPVTIRPERLFARMRRPGEYRVGSWCWRKGQKKISLSGWQKS